MTWRLALFNLDRNSLGSVDQLPDHFPVDDMIRAARAGGAVAALNFSPEEITAAANLTLWYMDGGERSRATWATRATRRICGSRARRATTSWWLMTASSASASKASRGVDWR